MTLPRWPAIIPALCFITVCNGAGAGGQDQPGAAPANPVAAQSLDGLSATTNRPLFSPSRRPPQPPPPVVEAAPPGPAPQQPPPNLMLVGVVMDGEEPRVLVRTETDRKIVRAKIGDEIEGWKVSQIEGRKMVISHDERHAAFALFADDRARSGKARPATNEAEPQGSTPQTSTEQSMASMVAPPSERQKRRRRSRE